MKVSFLILNYHTTHHVRLCIKHILALDLPFAYEIVMADNASNDGSVELVRELYPSVRIIMNGANLGHPSGNNQGLKVIESEYTLMINPDTIFRRSTAIIKVIDYLDQHPDVALLGPRLHNPDGTIQSSCYRRYGRWTPLYRRTFLGKLPFARRDIARHLMLDFDHSDTREVDWILGACLFIRMTAMKDIGLMNDNLFLYFGDYDWCDRAWLHNWKVVYYHDTDGIIHYHKRESASSRFSVPQIFSYVTRIHIKDWMTYRRSQPVNHRPSS